MPSPRRPSTLADLERLDDDSRAELIDGRIYGPRVTTFEHGHIAALLVMELGPPFQLGRGGPGDWWIQGENDFVANGAERLRPDALGWKKNRLVESPAGRRVVVVPDWVCEILSPSGRPYKQRIKRAAYARVGVRHRWYVDPAARTLSVFELESGAWIERGVFCDDEVVEAPPFEGVRLAMKEWWVAPQAAAAPKAKGKPGKLGPAQARVLEFLKRYIELHGRAPAEREIETHLQLSPPTIHGAILALEKKGLIARTPGVARSIRVLASAASLSKRGR
jgi:Uma2 family endonuclease